jgi:YihY family inner membrane protein
MIFTLESISNCFLTMGKEKNAGRILGRLLGFAMKVLRGFKRNQGLLLSGAVAFYTLLSIVPMSIIALIVLSHFIGEERLFHTLSTYIEMVVPGYAATLTEQTRVFLEHRKAVGIIGFLFMLFFSSITFTVIENAMSVIFFHRAGMQQRRSLLTSFIIPYVYILLMGLGILLVSFITGAVDALENRQLVIFGWNVQMGGTSSVALNILGIFGEALMLTSIYMVMPVVRVAFRHALIGGITVTILWEIVRRLLVWYYSVLSKVNLIYGSLAAPVVALLTIEAAAIILLLGAEVIAELERKPDETS